MIDFRRLRYFLTVADEGHITRAAARLGMQQPPLTQQIQALERDIGAALFFRTVRGVVLTPAGKALARDGRAVMQALDTAVERARLVARGHSGVLPMGFTTSAVMHPLVPGIIRGFRARFPAVQLELHENSAGGLTSALARRDLKLAIIREPVARPAEVAFIELLREDLLLVLAAGHPLLRNRTPGGSIEIGELAKERFILVRQPGAPGIYQNVVLACRAAGFEPNVVAEVGHMLTNINLVAAGEGISMVPASMREVNLRQVVYCPLSSAMPLAAPLTLAYLDTDADPMLANFIAIARDQLDAQTLELRDGAPNLGA